MSATMFGFVGVAGFAGAGKTTAVEQLSKLTGGKFFYLGDTIFDELRARGLSETRENERKVRMDLRREKGPGAFAIPYIDKVAACVRNEIPVFIDAIFTQTEFDLLASGVPSGSARLLGIEASFDIRKARLERRKKRPFSRAELVERDKIELESLGTGAVIAAAEYTISNEESLEEFYRKLAAFVSCCA